MHDAVDMVTSGDEGDMLTFSDSLSALASLAAVSTDVRTYSHTLEMKRCISQVRTMVVLFVLDSSGSRRI